MKIQTNSRSRDRVSFPHTARRTVISAAVAASLGATLPSQAVFAQDSDDDALDEVIVTGSFIRNSKFAQNNPVETVTQADLIEAGQPNVAVFIRDLTFTQNTNVVANVNAGSAGTQSSVGTTFNLRGLGENSTLTLMDGVRSVDNGINTLLPDIAIDRLEVVLDGGSAIYGSDAVAGVINLIPIKEFDGFRTQLYYQQDSENTFDDAKFGALWGKTFDNGLSLIVAGDYAHTSPLMTFERPRTLRVDNGWTPSGDIGSWRELVGATPSIGERHGGAQTGLNLSDPDCGAFNSDGTPNNPDPDLFVQEDLGMAFNNPSSIPVSGFSDGPRCYFTYSAQWPLVEGKIEWTAFTNLQYEANDSVTFFAQMSHASRESDNHNTLSYQLNANNREVLVVPEEHPNNPFGFDVGPRLWRPFALGGTLPSYADPRTGARKQRFQDRMWRYKFGADFEITDQWVGNTYYSFQRFKQRDEDKMVNLPNLQAGLLGLGGPNCDPATGTPGVGDCSWYNPFGSKDPRSPNFVQGATDNSQELVDFIAPQVNFIDLERDLQIFELNFTGPLFEMPAGTVYMATGYQYRNTQEDDLQNPLSAAGLDYNTSAIDSPPVPLRYGSAVNAAYLEFEVPILENFDAQLAVRHEDFRDFNLSTTVPKVALRWEAMPTLAIRGSIGESFLAPTPEDARPFDPNENCGEIFFGPDPLTDGSLQGGASCSSGNPNLKPETSDIWNLGFTWEPVESLSVSLDYQSIEYTDRIRTLSTNDVVGIEFEQMLAAIGSTAEAYDATPGSATRTAANNWLATVGNPNVTRSTVNQQVVRVVRQAGNVSDVFVDLFDGRINYNFDSGIGNFDLTASVTYYTNYEYQGFGGELTDALGKQNWVTGIVPVIPEFKAQFRANWLYNNHSASAIVNWSDEVEFDAPVGTGNLLSGLEPPADGIIEGQAYLNLNYQYRFDDLFGSQVGFRAGINNALDQQPQLLPILGGFESRVHIPWGRQYFVSFDIELPQ